MSGSECGKSGRKHTPITSGKQQGLFGSEYARRKAGKKGRMSGITTKELSSHLKESKGKDLPYKANPVESPTLSGASEEFKKKFYSKKD